MQVRQSVKALGRSAGRLVPQPVKRVMRAGKMLATDRRLPLWVRILWVAGVQTWCPLPIDEAALVVAAAVTFILYRPVLRDAVAVAVGRA